jgi:hypothetical protein
MIQSLLKGAHPVGRLCQPPALLLKHASSPSNDSLIMTVTETSHLASPSVLAMTSAGFLPASKTLPYQSIETKM